MLSPDQEKTIKSYAEQRDVLLGEISSKTVERDTLDRQCIEKAASNTELSNQISFKTGVLQKIHDEEIDSSKKISKEFSDMRILKITRQHEIKVLTTSIELLSDKKENLLTDISKLMPIYDRVTWQINQLTDTVKTVVGVNKDNTEKVNQLIANLKETLSIITKK